MKDRTAIVGIGYTPYYKRGQSVPETKMSMACTAILGALEDAGLSVTDLDGFTLHASAIDPAYVASILGVPEVRFAATLTSGGGGAAGSLGLAAAAICSGQAEVCVTLITLQQTTYRLGGTRSAGNSGAAHGVGYGPLWSGVAPTMAFHAGSGLGSMGHSVAVLTQRHMYQYGTTREHLAEIAITQRNNAIPRETALH